jgi:pyruvate/2-oxoglutarate dehydrogenase complex dihydrolipoamide dehydrogenase (E3) component
VNKNLQTANSDVYAVGDCLPGYKFTHNSDIHARMVVQNALLNGQTSQDDIILPFTTYTDPEIATVGKTKAMLTE